MKIQILQGKNLENDCTTVKITLEEGVNDESMNIIEKIKGFHSIFLKNYKIQGKTLVIQSKLPHLWKEIAKVLNTDNVEEKALTIIRKQIKSMSTISVLEVADQMEEEITPFLLDEMSQNLGYGKYNRQYCIGCGRRSTVAISFSTTNDSQMARQVQSDKFLTNTLLNRLKIPNAKWEIIESGDHLKKIFTNYQKPVVIKPTSLTGGRGVHTKIENLEDAFKAYENIKNISENKQNQTMIQEQIDGEDYRILVVNGKVEAVTKRIPAFVTGDGKSTIKELVEKINEDPRRDINDPTHILKPIRIDENLVNYLQEQNLNLKSIPKNNEQIFVRKVASMSQGGITEDFTDKVNKQIIYISETLAHSLRAYVLGIDVICKDITLPLTKENGGIIEANTMPEAYLNMLPVLGPQRPQIAKKLLDGLLHPLETKRVVILGGDFETAKEKIKDLKGNIGIYSSNTIYINNELIEKGIETDKAVQALKINSYLDNIVLHYKTKEEVEKYGFGFDKIDKFFEIKE